MIAKLTKELAAALHATGDRELKVVDPETFRVIILPQAHRDIDWNAAWWADHHSVEQAVRWADTVYVQIETLAGFPESNGLTKSILRPRCNE